MTDNGLAALAAALHLEECGDTVPFSHVRHTPKAAAILGERGVFLPSVPYEGDDRTICECGLDMDSHAGGFALLHHDGFVAREQAATIATLRAALDGTLADNGLAALAAALDTDHPLTGYVLHGLGETIIHYGPFSPSLPGVLAGMALGERGVFLPDGRPGEWLTLADGTETIREQAATIATLRAALEMVVAQKWWRNWGTGANAALDAARAALATAKEAGK